MPEEEHEILLKSKLHSAQVDQLGVKLAVALGSHNVDVHAPSGWRACSVHMAKVQTD